MTEMTCKTCQMYLPDLLVGADVPSGPLNTHLASCPACLSELKALRATFALLDEWTAPEPSAFFDTRLHARLRQEQAAAPEGVWERLLSSWRFSTGRAFRPALAGALALTLLLGGGTAVTLLTEHGNAPAASSPTVNDLKILDNNAQALQQMDMLDDNSASSQPAS